jgi:cytochrome c-type biogenesis protein CcmH/NrfG
LILFNNFYIVSPFSLDPTYVKALHRRATARVGLKRYGDAVQDFEQVLRLEPNNKMASTELQKIRQELKVMEFHICGFLNCLS